MFAGIDKAAELARRTANEERRPPTGVPSHDLHHHRNTGPMAKAKDGDVPRYNATTGLYEPAAVGGNPIAWWNNSDGTMDASRYQQFDQHYRLGDTSWFSFPEGGDTTLIMMQQPGIVLVTCSCSGNGDFNVSVEAGNDAVIAEANSAIGERVTCSSGAVFAADEFGGFEDWPNIQVKTPGGASLVFCQLTVVHWAGDPVFSAH